MFNFVKFLPAKGAFLFIILLPSVHFIISLLINPDSVCACMRARARVMEFTHILCSLPLHKRVIINMIDIRFAR